MTTAAVHASSPVAASHNDAADSHSTLVQRTFFTGPDARVADGLYVEVDRERSDRTRARLVLAPGACASTNTYFGRFAASFWQRYAELASVRLEFDHQISPQPDAVAGPALRVELWASDPSGRQRPLGTTEFAGNGHASLDIAIDRFVDGGAVWFDLVALGATVSVSDVRWSIPTPERNRQASVVVCTHNRPEDCIDTVTALASDEVAMASIASIHIVDQGDQRVADRERFAAMADLLGDKLIYLTQPNLGGAGGFNRGIYELSPGGVTEFDIIVMDDDILCEPESVLRMTSFANASVAPVLVGAQMLLLSETYRLHMGAEWEVLDKIKAGEPTAYASNGLNLLENHLDGRSDAGWNGWWSCLLPAEAVNAMSLSLPLFFQWDDIEFGIRARHSGFPTVTLPNAGVWHADFHLKDYDDWSRYFSWRNGMIVSAIHGRFDGTTIAKTVADEIGSHIVAMQYGLAQTLMLAVSDFLTGPSVLDDGGQSKLAELKKLRADYPETVIRPASEVGAQADNNTRIALKGPEPDESKIRLVLAKRLAKQIAGRLNRAPVSIPADSAQWWHVSQFDNAIVTDASQRGVRVRRRDRDTVVRQSRELAALCLRIRSEAPEIQRTWREAMPQLTSRENWKRLFDGE